MRGRPFDRRTQRPSGWLVRRGLQAAALGAFLVLLFYVVYPYTARPARVWPGWTPEAVDAHSGRVDAAAETTGRDFTPGQVLYAQDTSGASPEPLGAFRVVEVGPGRLGLQAIGDLSSERMDKLAGSFGPWTLCEQNPTDWPSHYARDLAAKEIVPAELFLWLDPLLAASAALAGRAWVWPLAAVGIVLLISLVVPRGFCAYLCPLGTVIDLFDATVGRWGQLRASHPPRRSSPAAPGRLRWLKYYVLAVVLGGAALGTMLGGFVSAIPVVTRAMVFLLAPLQTAAARGWHQVPPWNAGHVVSVMLFGGLLALGLLRPRFWCRYLCPTGALFSLCSVFRLVERRVEQRCTGCGRCLRRCPFDAIQDDYSTRPLDCAFCRTCQSVCPSGAIRYGWRLGEAVQEADVPRLEPASPAEALPGENDGLMAPPHAACAALPMARAAATQGYRSVNRRRFVAGVGGLAAAAAGGAAIGWALGLPRAANGAAARSPLRPPGSVPEPQFLALCVRCGECFRACPNDALQPLGFEHGLAALWTPHLVPDWSGCEPSCANCGQVCPTGAIRPLPIDEKRKAALGLAIVDTSTCLPHARREECRLCFDECAAAGYHAIEFLRVGTEVDERGIPLEDSGFLAPVVLAERCTGCGLCQTRCRAINLVQRGLLAQSAIRIEAKDK